MPYYTYLDENKHERIEYHPYGTNPLTTCPDCGEVMWRKPTAPRINWNGLKPSQGEFSPAVRNLVNNEQENREKYQEKKADYERRKRDLQSQAYV